MPTPLIIGLSLWLGIVLIVLAALRAAARADDLADRHAGVVAEPIPATGLPGRSRRRHLAMAEAATLGLVAVLAVRASRDSDWQPAALAGLLGALAIAGDLQGFRARRFRISASFPALVLAMALLGPAPAVAIGVACALADAALTRPRFDQLTSNLLGYALPALVGGMLLRHTEDREVTAVGVIGVYLLASGLNFTLIAGHTALLARGGFRTMIRTELVPVLPWETCAAAVTAVGVYVYDVRGPGGLAVLATAAIGFQWLLRSVVQGAQRASEIEHHADELGEHNEQTVGLVLNLLALRDPAFARHAAAVAHHARELARAAGMTRREQEIAHAAGLLHDIGRQTFPDALLAMDQPVDDGGREVIRNHPVVGAQLLRRLPGLWEVADAVETHHEHIDGSGYPHGLTGGRIPRIAKIVAIAEAYDVLTAEDSYRGSRDHEWAGRELRRVSGTQLDATLVDLFLEKVPHAGRRPSLEEELPALRTAFGLLGARPAAW